MAKSQEVIRDMLNGTLDGGGPADTPCAGPAGGSGEELSLERLPLLGLNALARAHEFNYFTDGHRGASIVAAYLLCTDNHLDARATARVAELIRLNWASTPLCRAFPQADADLGRIDDIGAALIEGADTLRQVGHNAIFAMLAIKALRMLPCAATRQRAEGICAMA
jgi:hypothetical protein